MSFLPLEEHPRPEVGAADGAGVGGLQSKFKACSSISNVLKHQVIPK